MADRSESVTTYELSAEQNVDVRSIGSHAIAWGTVCALVAVACLALAALGIVGKLHGAGWRLYMPVGLVNAVLGVNFIVAGRDFRAAVHRDGCDITHVMVGLGHMSRAVMVQIIVAVASVLALTASAFFVGGP